MNAFVWTAALAVALLWPGRALAMFDGVPLDGRVEAIAIGVLVPSLWWAHRSFLTRPQARVLIVALIAVKAAAALLLVQQGLCGRFAAPAPITVEVLTIPIEEPTGALRSWDARADWRAEAPACTAIIGRPYADTSSFPAWFVNITDFVKITDSSYGTPRTRAFTLDVSGFVRVSQRGQFTVDLDRDMAVNGRIGSTDVASAAGASIVAALDAGVHPIRLRAALTGDRWRFVPRWNGRDAFAASTMTVGEPRAIDRWAAPAAAFAMTGLVIVLLCAWIWSFLVTQRESRWALLWCAAVSLVLIAVATTGRFERPSTLLLFAGAIVPMAAPQRNIRGAWLLMGVPWLAFFVARSAPLIGHFSAYSNDDWLVYQVAGYRIFMNGYWLEAGNKLFDYQPLYRWISGGLHLIFGDSSVGETYWDAACLLMGGLLAFCLARGAAGFRAGLIACAATLAIFTLATTWYFIGRGLGEAAASGFAFMAAGCLMRARLGRLTAAAAAGVFATLMFYTRLNHLLFACFLPALLLALRTSARWSDVRSAIVRIRARAALMYAAVFAFGFALFPTRTWWYTGSFSLFLGTSLHNNDLGLRLSTIASPIVWRRIGHSLWSLVWVNDQPAHPDPRSFLVAAGALLAALAILQVPRVNRLPASLAIVTLGAMASAFFVHTHNYPGRLSLHFIPFAVATSVTAAATLGRRA